MNYSVYCLHKLANLVRHNSSVFSFQKLRQVHAKLITSGFVHSDPSCLFSVLGFLSESSSLNRQASIFTQFQSPSSLTWHHIVLNFGLDANPLRVFYLFRAMKRAGHDAHLLHDPHVYASLIRACNNVLAIRQGKCVHCYVVRLGLDSNVNVSNSLIFFYASSLKSMRHACDLFDRIPVKTVVTANCMISGFVKNGYADMAFSFFNHVLGCSFDLGLKPNHVTMVILLSGCAEFGAFGVGTSLKAYCWKMGFVSRMEVSNALIDFYAKFNCMNGAAKLFNNLPVRDLISWNTMISGYARSNKFEKAISFFREMMAKNIGCDRISLISMILVSANGKNLKMGKVVHGFMKTRGILMTVPIGIALINMYFKCGLVDSARNVFNKLPDDNIATMNSMIHGYVECGHNIEALSLFNVIQSRMFLPDEVTMLGLIMACRNSGDIHHGTDIHSYIESTNDLKDSLVLQNALIDMYAKCGSMSTAELLFDKMPVRDVISWTSIIVGHAINGEGEKAILAFCRMEAEKIKPNHVTFIGVLSACDHAGLVDEGRNFYDAMYKVHNIEPRIEHCGCMVDMLARAGMLDEAYKFVKKMPVEPNGIIWRMLINACRVNANIDLGLSFVHGLMEPKALNTAEDHVLSCNIFAEAGRWDEVLCKRHLMTTQKLAKEAGKSTISNVTERITSGASKVG